MTKNIRVKEKASMRANVYKFKMISINLIQLNIVVSRKTLKKVREVKNQQI